MLGEAKAQFEAGKAHPHLRMLGAVPSLTRRGGSAVVVN
jgi:hypothetical protein